jgi:succinate dehydrogenase / fumarate reductase membrane anchor subunit
MKPPKRPRDPAQLAKLIVDIATGEADDEVNSTDLPPHQHRQSHDQIFLKIHEHRRHQLAGLHTVHFRHGRTGAIGLGSAKKGSQLWLAERVTAIALVPLTLWFVASVIAHACCDYTVFTAWVRTPLATSGMILLLIALFHHAALGLQVVIEDYVHSGAKFAAIIAVRLGCYGLAGVGIVATLRIAFGG